MGSFPGKLKCGKRESGKRVKQNYDERENIKRDEDPNLSQRNETTPAHSSSTAEPIEDEDEDLSQKDNEDKEEDRMEDDEEMDGGDNIKDDNSFYNDDDNDKYPDDEEIENDNEVKQGDESENEKQEDENEDEDEEEEDEDRTTWDGKPIKVEYSGNELKALRGYMDIVYPEKTQIVRIFTSSTFTDTSVERNTLMETVYPKLKIYCQKKGFEFQVVDMRWGVRDEATDDHMTTELCMKELYACQKISTGPNFITFLGQKYGYRPFPPKIVESEFVQLLEAVSNEDRSTLQRWFKLDSNAVPKEYILQPITSILPDYRNYDNHELRKAASNEWWSCFERMQIALRKSALKVLNKADQQKYLMSVTEDEIRRGVITAKCPEKYCFWFKRNISDLHKNISAQKAASFIDKVWGKEGLDEDAQTLLQNLRENDLPKALPKGNVKIYDVKWNNNGINPATDAAHDTYIKRLCSDFYSILSEMINDGIARKQSKERNTEEIFEEIFQHGTFCQKKCKTFHGRKPFLEDIMNEIENGTTTLVLHGPSGCGKTSVMAKVASSVKSWIGDKKSTVILRFIGTTANSFAIRDLLKSICTQLCKATGHKTDDLPEDLKSLKEYLSNCLELAAEKHPVVLMLDSLDQLSSDDGGLLLEWLPRTLPSDVYMILSTLPEDQYICLPKLKTQFPPECFKAIPKMSTEEAGDILDKWLHVAKRSLTTQQRQIVLDSFNKCPLPLFLKLVFDEACRWKSYTPEDETLLPSTIREIIHSLFDRLEKIHGRTLVSRSLAYISGSKSGLSGSEIEDLLSLDDDVLNDVYQYWTPPVRRLPPLLWLRIRADLGDYLVERGSDGARVSFWYHRQFIEVSRERYLHPEQCSIVYSSMADYFLGEWSDGKKKRFVNKKGEQRQMDRLVAQQPLMFDTNEDSLVFNKRKLAELPYQLVKSKHLERLKEKALCNFEFLLAKLRAMSHDLVMDDFRMALNEFPEDEELRLLNDTLALCKFPLTLEPRQLASQLIGRLFHMKDDSSLSQMYPFIAKLFEQLGSSSVPCFVPNSKCLTSPGGPLLHAIAEHDGNSMIDSMCLAHDNSTLVTTVRGDEGLEIRTFNLRSGMLERKLILTEPNPDVFYIWHTLLSHRDKQKMVMIGGRNLLVFDLKSGQVVHTIEALSEDLMFNQTGYEGPPVGLGQNDQRLSALTDKGVKIWSMETGKLDKEIPVSGIDSSGCMGTLDASSEHVAFCKKGSLDVIVANIASGKTVQTIRSAITKGNDSYVKYIRITDQGRVIVLSSNSTELKVYDIASGQLEKEVAGFSINSTAKELIITNDGKKLVCQDKFELAIWDLTTWKCRKVLNDMAHVHSPNVKTNDAKIVVHANVADHIVRVYDASKDESKETTAAPTKTDQWVISQINASYPVNDSRHVIITATANMSAEISIWDAKQGKQVRVFKNIMFYPSVLRMLSPTVGVGYIYNEKRHHYMVFDFGQGKVLRQLQGKACKRMHMMDFLDSNRMVSFSRGRRNLKIWNIQSGKVVQQIKLGQKYRLEAFLLSGNKKIMVIAQAGSYSKEIKDTTVPLVVYNFATGKHHEIREEDSQLKLESTGLSLNAAISDSGRYVVSVQEYTAVTLWDVANGCKKHSLNNDPPTGAYYSCAISENKNIVLTSYTGSSNGINVWNIESGKCMRNISTVTSVNEIVLNEKLVFSKDMQGSSFYVHDLDNGRNLATFTSDKPIAPQAFNVVENRVVIGATGSADPTVFYLRRHDKAKPPFQKQGSSIYEDGSDAIKQLDYNPNTSSSDSNDEDDDKDDDDGQAA